MPSRKSPASASRGAKAMACSSPSSAPHSAAERREQRGHVVVLRHVAAEERRRPELGGDLRDALLELVVHVGERERGAFALARLRDAVGDRAIRQDARDQDLLAGEKAHRDSGGGPWSGIRKKARSEERRHDADHAARDPVVDDAGRRVERTRTCSRAARWTGLRSPRARSSVSPGTRVDNVAVPCSHMRMGTTTGSVGARQHERRSRRKPVRRRADRRRVDRDPVPARGKAADIGDHRESAVVGSKRDEPVPDAAGDGLEPRADRARRLARAWRHRRPTRTRRATTRERGGEPADDASENFDSGDLHLRCTVTERIISDAGHAGQFARRGSSHAAR